MWACTHHLYSIQDFVFLLENKSDRDMLFAGAGCVQAEGLGLHRPAANITVRKGGLCGKAACAGGGRVPHVGLPGCQQGACLLLAIPIARMAGSLAGNILLDVVDRNLCMYAMWSFSAPGPGYHCIFVT